MVVLLQVALLEGEVQDDWIYHLESAQCEYLIGVCY